MPATTGVEVEGLDKAQLKLRGFARRMVLPQPALEAGVKVIEAGEEDLFTGFGGKFIRTGALRESLTQSDARGAIRRAHGEAIEFGSSIWYAHFQKKIGGPSGKPRGRKRVGKTSLVLKVSKANRALVRQVVLDYFLAGAEE
jgi:hypothetical protein